MAMMTTALLALPLAADFFSSRTLGEAVLISVVAIVLGYVVARLWPKDFNPSLFGFLAALTLVGGLAYAGNAGASLAIFVVAVGGGIILFAGSAM